MNNWIIIYIVVFCCGAAGTLMLTPLFAALARRTGFLDMPSSNHKRHANPTPLLGGASLFTAWIAVLAGGIAAVRLGFVPGFWDSVAQHLPGFIHVLKQLNFIILGAALAVALGLWDDKYALKASTKFGGQFIIALIAVLLGNVRVNIFCDNQFLICAASVFWLMLMMNSINFFDNMDGLAVGVIAIAMAFFAIISGLNGQYFMATISALNCGVCCGFWYYNAAPAAIFMGDAGSHFLGYLAAVTAAGVSFFDKGYSLSRFPVLIPLLILALPLFDTAMVVIIRTCNRKPFWIGDHNHISHRFVRMGLSRPMAVLLVQLTALAISLITLPIYWGDFRTAAILVIQAGLLLVIITILQLYLGKPEQPADNKKTESEQDLKNE